MAKMLLASVADDGVITLDRTVPDGNVLLGAGFAYKLRRVVRDTADRDPSTGILRVPAFTSAPDSIVRYRRSIKRVLRAVPERWAERPRPTAPIAIEAPLWRRMRDVPAPQSLRELAVAIGATSSSVETRLKRWVRAGLVDRIEGKPLRYRLAPGAPATPMPPQVSPTGAARPRARTQRDHIWSAMRVLTRFDLPMLMIASGATRRSAEDYVNVLQRAGYVRQTLRGNPVTGVWSIYVLVQNTGPKAPSISHSLVSTGGRRELVDRNTGARIDVSPAATSLRKSAPPAGGGVG